MIQDTVTQIKAHGYVYVYLEYISQAVKYKNFVPQGP